MNSLLFLLTILGVLFGLSNAAEAQKPWLGRWKSSSAKPPVNWDAFIQALELPVERFGGNPQDIITITADGDLYKMGIDAPHHNYIGGWHFRLGATTTLIEPKYNNTPVMITYAEDGDKLVVNAHIPAKGKSFREVFAPNGNHLVKTYDIGNIVAKRFFEKEAEQPIPMSMPLQL